MVLACGERGQHHLSNQQMSNNVGTGCVIRQLQLIRSLSKALTNALSAFPHYFLILYVRRAQNSFGFIAMNFACFNTHACYFQNASSDFLRSQMSPVWWNDD